jgi:hypothetical protein
MGTIMKKIDDRHGYREKISTNTDLLVYILICILLLQAKSAHKSSTMETVPKVLTFHLQRVSFDREKQERAKVLFNTFFI